MADETQYDKARDLAEKALDAFVDGDEDKAAELAEKAKATDPQAVKDVSDELADDDSSEHDIDKINEDLGSDADKK